VASRHGNAGDDNDLLQARTPSRFIMAVAAAPLKPGSNPIGGSYLEQCQSIVISYVGCKQVGAPAARIRVPDPRGGAASTILGLERHAFQRESPAGRPLSGGSTRRRPARPPVGRPGSRCLPARASGGAADRSCRRHC
jgi:hypothetical protein